jgi:hypothetical protein
MASTQSLVLDLDTLTDRPVVRINQKDYRLWSIDLLPPIENHRIRKLMKRNDEHATKDDQTKAEEAELKTIFDQITRVVLDAPDAIHKKLTDKQRAEVIRTFQMPSLDLLTKVLAAAMQGQAAAPTGETSPGGSPASTT